MRDCENRLRNCDKLNYDPIYDIETCMWTDATPMTQARTMHLLLVQHCVFNFLAAGVLRRISFSILTDHYRFGQTHRHLSLCFASLAPSATSRGLLSRTTRISRMNQARIRPLLLSWIKFFNQDHFWDLFWHKSYSKASSMVLLCHVISIQNKGSHHPWPLL